MSFPAHSQSIDKTKYTKHHQKQSITMKQTRPLKQALASALAMAGLAVTSHAATLALHYTFDEGFGTAAASSVGSTAGNTLTLVGNSSWAPSMAGFGSAMQITGVSGRAEAVDKTTWSAQTITGSSIGSMSMALWINFSSFPTTGVPTLMGSVSSAPSYHHQMLIRMDGTNTRLPNDKANAWGQTFGSGASVATSRTDAATEIATGVWNHYAVTFDSTTKTSTLYINGNFASAATNAAWTGYWDAADLVRSIVGSDANNSISGLYDDARVYNGALSPSEVAALAVPEPSSAILLGLGGFALLRRRRA